MTTSSNPSDLRTPVARFPTALRFGVAVAVIALLVLLATLLQQTPGRGAPAALSLVLGAALGIVFERGRFCYFCILRDGIEYRNSTPIYAILAALAVGSIGYTIVLGAFMPNPGSGRLPAEAHIGPVSWVLILAGLLFGLGMALSGACISGHLFRIAQGSTRAPVALLGSVVGFGLGLLSWNPLYTLAIADAPIVWLPTWLGYGGALALQLALLGAIGLALLPGLPELPAQPPRRLSLKSISQTLLSQRWPPLTTGALVGIISVVAYLRIEPLGVTSQLGSIARTLLDGVGLMPVRLYGLDDLAGCATAVVRTITNNGLLVGGLVLGAFAAALAANSVKPDRPTPRGVVSALLGGILQGWSALIALGCTVGTLLSGITAFALSGWVFALALVGGVWLGIRLKLHT